MDPHGKQRKRRAVAGEGPFLPEALIPRRNGSAFSACSASLSRELESLLRLSRLLVSKVRLKREEAHRAGCCFPGSVPGSWNIGSRTGGIGRAAAGEAEKRPMRLRSGRNRKRFRRIYARYGGGDACAWRNCANLCRTTTNDDGDGGNDIRPRACHSRTLICYRNRLP